MRQLLHKRVELEDMRGKLCANVPFLRRELQGGWGNLDIFGMFGFRSEWILGFSQRFIVWMIDFYRDVVDLVRDIVDLERWIVVVVMWVKMV